MPRTAATIAHAAEQLKALAEENNQAPEPVTTELANAAQALADLADRLDRLELIPTE